MLHSATHSDMSCALPGIPPILTMYYNNVGQFCPDCLKSHGSLSSQHTACNCETKFGQQPISPAFPCNQSPVYHHPPLCALHIALALGRWLRHAVWVVLQPSASSAPRQFSAPQVHRHWEDIRPVSQESIACLAGYNCALSCPPEAS